MKHSEQCFAKIGSPQSGTRPDPFLKQGWAAAVAAVAAVQEASVAAATPGAGTVAAEVLEPNNFVGGWWVTVFVAVIMPVLGFCCATAEASLYGRVLV